MKRRKKNAQQFWNEEYKSAAHLALSMEPAEDLEKFCRWMERRFKRVYLNPEARVVDVGCGNGRNSIYLAQQYGVSGLGYDISHHAIEQAKKNSEGLKLTFEERNLTDSIPVEDESQTFVLDMMSSHVLDENQRKEFRKEVARVIVPGGWLLWKTFLLEEDRHAKKLLYEAPAGEEGSYIHPKIGILEHVVTKDEIYEVLENDFEIHKISPSHRHRGKRGKRRTVMVYAQKL